MSQNGHTAPGRPNILFIFADQMHRYAMRCMGTADILTPNLDRLARQGTLFTNAYTNCPVCTPARINFLTGLYTSQTNTFGNEKPIPPACPTIADTLNTAGYQTGFVGKWHIGASGNQPIPEHLRGGFRQFMGYQCYNGFLRDVCFYDEANREHRFDRHREDVTADLTIERLQNMAAAGQPFALFTAFQAPHYPVQPSEEYERLYRGRTIARRRGQQDVDPYTRTWSPRSPWPPDTCPDYQRYGKNLDEYLRLYYALVTQVDANVGRILDALDATGAGDNTLVIFTADHGDMQGSHGRLNKCLPHEMSSGVPLIVRTPRASGGRVCPANVSGVDFMPTMLEWAGLNARAELPGHSLLPLLSGDVWDHPAFSEMHDWKMVRRGSWKLVTDAALQPTMLFDLATDPHELQNLLGRPEVACVTSDLLACIRQWQALPRV